MHLQKVTNQKDFRFVKHFRREKVLVIEVYGTEWQILITGITVRDYFTGVSHSMTRQLK